MPLLIILFLLSATFFSSALPATPYSPATSVAEGEEITLPFSPEKMSVDVSAEETMLELLNIEREKHGLNKLVLDDNLTTLARAHSADMWQRQYFAHIAPDGKTPLDRMKSSGIKFAHAGENLALTKTIERAHEGLMESPGHRRNILDPKFGRVGIGVIDGGIYGKMFTQEFAD